MSRRIPVVAGWLTASMLLVGASLAGWLYLVLPKSPKQINNTAEAVQPAAAPVQAKQLVNQSETSGPGPEWQRRIWFTDQPSHLTPERVHGGIGP